MKSLKYTLTLAILIFLCSCGIEETTVNEQSIEQEVNEMFDAYTKHVNTTGLKGVDYYFSKDKRFYWVEDGVMQYPDRETLLAGIEAFYPSVTSIELVISKKKVTVLDHSTATLYVEYKEDIVLDSGYVVKLDGAMTILTIREDESWKFLIGHSSVKKPRGSN